MPSLLLSPPRWPHSAQLSLSPTWGACPRATRPINAFLLINTEPLQEHWSLHTVCMLLTAQSLHPLRPRVWGNMGPVPRDGTSVLQRPAGTPVLPLHLRKHGDQSPESAGMRQDSLGQPLALLAVEAECNITGAKPQRGRDTAKEAMGQVGSVWGPCWALTAPHPWLSQHL